MRLRILRGMQFEDPFKTHSGEKPNICNQCDYASSRADVLRKHLKTHGGEKTNKCNQCNYASYEAGDLRIHLKTHSGEKSIKCNQCDSASITLITGRISNTSHFNQFFSQQTFRLFQNLSRVYLKHLITQIIVNIDEWCDEMMIIRKLWHEENCDSDKIV